MASFFQPGSNDPAITDCEIGRFQVYCNSILPAGDLLQTWYQKVNLILGAVTLVVPALYGLYLLVSMLWRERSQGLPSIRRKQDGLGLEVTRTPPSMAAFKAAKSFRIVGDADGHTLDPKSSDYELLRLPISINADGSENISDRSSVSSRMAATPVSSKMNLARVDLKTLTGGSLSDTDVSAAAQSLADTHHNSKLAGIALRCDQDVPAEQVNQLLEILYFKGIPILLLAPHDAPIWNSIVVSNASGVIVENACILPDGQRRDYFLARTLQTLMAKCNKEREDRPEFFVGFLDLWNTRPHPSIVRRAVKLAEHFGAVIEHGPLDPHINFGGPIRSATQTLSGFEFLRRAALTELQKLWSTESRKVKLALSGDSDMSGVAKLPLEGLQSVIPQLSECLSPKSLTTQLRELKNEQPSHQEAPTYVDLAPARDNFWELSSQGYKFSSRGCFPISMEPTTAHYDAVVKTQVHLRELQMLQPMKGADTHRLITALQRLTDSVKCHDLVHALIEGLETHQISIFKGLDTGFGVADGVAHFFGVSHTRDDVSDAEVDIYVTLKAPNDHTAILHTWLAHHGLPRAQRFDLEHQFELANKINDEKIDMPLSMKVAIERLSHAETLSLIQQIRISELKHHFCEPMLQFARLTLIDDASRFVWYSTVALNTLDGSMDIREIFQMRLEHYARLGATSLPTVDGLAQLYSTVHALVEESLFFGNREPLNIMTNALLEAWDPETSGDYECVDLNADFFALIFFTIMRKVAFEDVYVEATDRCPFFLSQPDQAAVFSELWVLGSQCEIYFGILPRALGAIVYNRYRNFLGSRPPSASARKGNEVMTMYSTGEAEPVSTMKGSKQRDGSAHTKMTSAEKVELWKQRFTELGAMSIFCLPAILDVILLSFVGRGVFMTAFMEPKYLQAAGLALLISLLLTSGVTGWVGSVGNYYLVNYAYDNMIYFHVERLSGGFVLTLVIAVCGIIGYSVEYGPDVGFVFAAYLIVIATYFNLLGVMATMHQQKSPLTSGRTILWRTFPMFLVSPLLSSFVNGYDLAIYLTVTYLFLFLALFQYRRLCHEWSNWMQNIPKFSEKDVLKWYETSGLAPKEEKSSEGEEDDGKSSKDKDSQEAFRQAVTSRRRGIKVNYGSAENDTLVAKIATGMPYVDWLFNKTVPGGKIPDAFSASWFTQLGESNKQQRQMARGLKEHNVLLLFRFARYDLGQNLGLFLVALMDRWVAIVMGARLPHASIYIDSRSRYALCFCILYFCASVMLLDTTLQKYWEVRFKLSEEKLVDYNHAQQITKEWESRRLKTFGKALRELFSKILCVFGFCTILMWMLVETPENIILYYCYILGYTCVMLMQFNRCFTTNVRAHITIILSSAGIGFVVGLVLRSLSYTAGWMYCEIVAQNVAAVLAATGTTLWTWKDWSSPSKKDESHASPTAKDAGIFVQTRLSADKSSDLIVPLAKLNALKGATVVDDNGSFTASEIAKLLRRSAESPNYNAKATSWAPNLLQTTIHMWSERRIVVKVASRQQFVRIGMEDVASVSQLRLGTLEITLGLLGDSEAQRPSWQPLLASLITESLLYHVARAEMKLTHAQAVRSEHFLFDTESMSKRLDFELAFADEGLRSRMILKTNVELMKHLCLDTAVDAQWELMPEPVRQAIINRISGEKLVITREFNLWVEETHVDVSTMDFHIDLSLGIYQKLLEGRQNQPPFAKQNQPTRLTAPALRSVKIHRSRSPQSWLEYGLRAMASIPFAFVKWVAVISGAGADIERELWYCLKDVYLQKPILYFLLLLWRACCFVKDLWVYVFIIYHRPTLVSITRVALKGARRKLMRNSIVVELPRKTITGFASLDDDSSMRLDVFDGACKEAPTEKKPMFTATYDNHLRLKTRIDGAITSTYNYPPNPKFKWPLSKEVSDEGFYTVGFYDKYGRISRGTLTIGDNEFAFQYHYKATPKDSTDVLSADFKLISQDSEDMLSVFWGVPGQGNFEDYDWVPSERIGRLVKVIDGKIYVTEAEYRHRRDPLITTFLQEDDGRKTAIAKSPRIFNEEALFLARPNNISFDMDDLMVYHTRLQVAQMKRYTRKKPSYFSYLNPMNWIASWGKQVYRPLPTWRIRTELWNLWLKTDTLDAPTACWLDEVVLRQEPRLRAYWRSRDAGRLSQAKQALDDDIDQIVSAIDVQTDVSEVCLLPIRTSDLYTMGLGKDATQVTTRPEDCFSDTEERVSVIFNDIGCWPEAPGGVSNCRRDLVNGHSTIRNHVLAECANDYGIPRFQVEKNVQSMKLLPLWGLDGKTAHHGLIDNLLQSQVDEKIVNTEVRRDIVGVFIPLLKDFVKGARTKQYSRADLIKYSNVMLSMCKYYESKDYSRTWSSPEVEQAWVDAWLLPYNDPNIIDPAKCFELERPTMSDFRDALGIYLAYFFIFSVKIPDRCPRVFQSTHHGISSLFGMILRYRRGVTFGIWDHAILWRECCLNISPAQCELPISVQSMLLSGIGLATRLAYFHADVIMPCTSLFNPMWEAEIGTDRGKLGSKRVFNRRIDPIVNGISNMESFNPVDKVRTDKPTVVMLSNVQFIKGIKTAILAADIIVNRYGFKDYQLVVYGAKDRQPSYALEMAKLIVENNLSDRVILAGFGKPKEILKDAWLFMNSSISEGLPLAIGEAALAGVPIVATEVGATALVMTDPDDQDKRYGEVVPPNDPLALARAQLNILGMVGPWAKFTEEAIVDPSAAASAVLPDEITPPDVEWLTRRMYEKTDDRRKLGLLSREVVLHSFHGNRYLREHEQMYWIQWHIARMRDDHALATNAAETFRFGAAETLRYTDEDEIALEVELKRAAVEADDDSDGEEHHLVRHTVELKRSRTNKSTMSKRLSLGRWQDFEGDADAAAEKKPKVPKRLSKLPPRRVEAPTFV